MPSLCVSAPLVACSAPAPLHCLTPPLGEASCSPVKAWRGEGVLFCSDLFARVNTCATKLGLTLGLRDPPLPGPSSLKMGKWH